MAAEWLRYHRFKRSIKYLEKSMKHLEDAGLDPKEVPLRTLVPLMESASLEDDEELSDRWAALLTNAATQANEVRPSFAKVLAELEPVDAQFLDELYIAAMRMAPEIRRNHGLNGPLSAEYHGLTMDQFHVMVQNLMRLGLCEAPNDNRDRWDGVFVITEFGRAFVRACWPPGKPDPAIIHTTETVMREVEATRARLAKEHPPQPSPVDQPPPTVGEAEDP